MPHRRRPPQSLAQLRLLLRLRLLKLRLRLKRRPLVTAGLLMSLVLGGCAEKPAPAPERPTGHIVTDQVSGVGLDLPSVWAGRYRVGDSIATPAEGLQRELSFRFRRADSTLVAEPMLVVRIFGTAAYKALSAEAAAPFGTMIAQDDAHTVAVRTASANPLAPGSADALAFDSLMMVVLQRPLRASLRPVK